MFIEVVIFLRKVIRNVIAASYDDPTLDQYDFTISGAFQSFLNWMRELCKKSSESASGEGRGGDLSLPLVVTDCVTDSVKDSNRRQSFPKGGKMPI